MAEYTEDGIKELEIDYYKRTGRKLTLKYERTENSEKDEKGSE